MHDLHLHTNLSACAPPESTLKVMLRALKEAGITTAGVANHIWDTKVPGASGWYAPQNVPHVLSIKEEYAALSSEERQGIKLYFGCETEYVGQGRVALKPESAELFDFVLVPPHHFHMKNFVRPADLTETKAVCRLMMARFMECCNIDFVFGLAHPFAPLGYAEKENEILSTFTDREFEDAFSYAAEKNKSVELNVSTTLGKAGLADADAISPELLRMYSIAVHCKCKFHLGSDAHDAARLAPKRFEAILKFAERCGITFAEDPLADR